MNEKANPSRLGRGLAQLIGESAVSSDVYNQDIKEVPIAFIRPNPKNPRLEIKDSELLDLANSIRSKGVMQPILVRQMAAEDYELIAGERRWRAAQTAGLHDIPVVIRNVSDQESLELAIIENVQRSDLNIIEEALGYQSLIQQFSYTQNEMAEVIGKSRAYVTNALRFLKLPEDIQSLLRQGELSAGHARALITVENPSELAKKIIKDGLSVRDIEDLVNKTKADAGASKKRSKNKRIVDSSSAKDADTLLVERDLEKDLGLKVNISHAGDKGGEISIQYQTIEQLDLLIQKLKN